jgi:hypothetical protein
MTGGLQRQNGKSSTTKSIFLFLLRELELAKGLEPPTL